MPITKTNCQIHNDPSVSTRMAAAPLPPSAPQICDQHPSFTQALDGLNAYERWVSSVIIPMAFQWIEEHKREVYRGIPNAMRDDIGVVVAAAFEKLQKRAYYRNGQKAGAAFKSGKLKPRRPINPIWGRISNELRNDTRSVFRAQVKLLKNTI